jgi:hypothetical protein
MGVERACGAHDLGPFVSRRHSTPNWLGLARSVTQLRERVRTTLSAVKLVAHPKSVDTSVDAADTGVGWPAGRAWIGMKTGPLRHLA